MPRTARTARKPAPKTATQIAEDKLRRVFGDFVACPNGANESALGLAAQEYREAVIVSMLESAKLRVDA